MGLHIFNSKFQNILLISFLFVFILTGCSNKPSSVLDPKSPVVVTLWHSYNSYVKKTFDKLILEFNETVGMEQGIIVDCYSYGDELDLEEAIFNSANHIIGSDPLPNIFTAYPSSAYRIDQLIPLLDFNDYFTSDELSKYCENFLSDGIWDGNPMQKVLPVAKSTEVLFLNKTDWDKFSSKSGYTIEDLSTWEGLTLAAKDYYKWSSGKSLLGINPFNNFMTLTAAQLGESTYDIDEEHGTFFYNSSTARKIWDNCYIPHIMGWYASTSYGSDGIKSGSLTAYIGSSAGAGYFPAEVSIDTENKYPIECLVLPYPTFKDGIPYMAQRGANMSIIPSDKSQEYAAAEFLKWFTAPEQNTAFAALTGYIPVEKKSLDNVDELLNSKDRASNNKAVTACVLSTIDFIKTKEFFTDKEFYGYYEAGNMFDESIFKKIKEDQRQLSLRIKNGESKEIVLNELTSDAAFTTWYNQLITQISSKIK